MATNGAAQATTFSITDTNIYVPVVTLSTQDNAKLLEQLKSGFKRTNNWNKFQPKLSPERPNQYLDFLNFLILCAKDHTIWSFSCSYFPVFRLNTGKYRPEKIPNTDNFHAVTVSHELQIL